VLLASGQSEASSIVADDGGVFWLTSSAVVTCPSAGCPDGGPLSVTPPLNHPSSLAIDDRYVYWASPGDGTVARCPRGGCPDGGTVIVQGTHPAMAVIHKGLLWWSWDTDGGDPHGYSRCNPDGCAGTTAYTTWTGEGQAPALLIGDPFVPTLPAYVSYRLGVDPTTTYVEWDDNDNALGTTVAEIRDAAVTTMASDGWGVYVGGTHGIKSCPLREECVGGRAPGDVTTVAPTSPLAMRSGVLYFVAPPGTVRGCVPSDCASPPLLAAQVVADPSGLAVDDELVYVTDRAKGLVWMVSR
jgi:hypothetical protein